MQTVTGTDGGIGLVVLAGPVDGNLLGGTSDYKCPAAEDPIRCQTDDPVVATAETVSDGDYVLVLGGYHKGLVKGCSAVRGGKVERVPPHTRDQRDRSILKGPIAESRVEFIILQN